MNNKVNFKTHGAANETFVCEHLVGASGIDWYSASPIKNDPWPSAWCEQCHQSFLKEDKWNEKSEQGANLTAKLLCYHCYEETKNNIMFI